MTHPFDEAMQLSPAGSHRPDTWLGSTSAAYGNMIGPFGGTTAASLLQAVLLHPARLGEPIALTVNFAAALSDGAFSITATPVRTNRSTQHWSVTLKQADDSGGDAVAATASAVTALRRPTRSDHELPMPATAFDDALPRLNITTSAWTGRYDMRALRGMIPQMWDGTESDSLTRLWLRDDPPRPLDFLSLAAMSDAFFPRVWLRRATRVPAGTVSISSYFHASSEELTQVGNSYLLGQARAQRFHSGFFDQTAQLWSPAGAMLATSSQMVYYKE